MDPAKYTTLCIKTHAHGREGAQSISHYKRLFLASLVDYVCPENVKQIAEKIHDAIHQNRKFKQAHTECTHPMTHFLTLNGFFILFLSSPSHR